MIYFSGRLYNKKIFKANTDGTNIVEIHNSNLKIFDLYIDVKRNYVYFNNRTTNSIHRIDYDGSGLTDIIQVL
jgi:hypothetical protein